MIGIGAVEEGGVRRDAEAALHSFLDAFNGDVPSALAADGEVVVLALAIEVYGEGEVLRRRKLRQAALQFKSVGAEVDVFLARNEAVDDFNDLRMQKRLTAGDRNHGCATFLDRGEALLGRELLLEDVRRVLHFAASGAGQVAAEERLEHEHKRIALLPGEALLQNVAGHCRHL